MSTDSSPSKGKSAAAKGISPAAASAMTRAACLVFVLAATATGRPFWCWGAAFSLLLFLAVSLGVHIHYRKGLRACARLEDAPPWPEGRPWPEVALVASARNEEAAIEAAVRSFAASDYANLSIYLIDDHSSDNTPAIVDRLAREFPQLHVVHDPPLQEGWGGKGNAIWHTVNNILPDSVKWMLITDADVRFHPHAITAAVAIAETAGVDHFTCVPRLEPKGLCEESALMTASWSLAIAAGNLQKKRREHAVGIGPFMMMKRELYVRSGGHAPFRATDPEDTNLARVIFDAGGVTRIGWTSAMLRFRHYTGYDEVRRRSVMKNRIYLHDSILSMADAAQHMLLADVLPLPTAIAAWCLHAHTPALLVFAAMGLLNYFAEVARFWSQRAIADIRWFVPWLHPFGGLLRIWFFVLAITQTIRHKAIANRGRNVSADPAEPGSPA